MEIRILQEGIVAPKALLSFSGWPDAGKTVELAFVELRRTLAHEPAAVCDMDGCWSTQTMRPQVSIRHGQIKQLDWPSYTLSVCSVPSAPSLVLGFGPEPSGNWRKFSSEILQLLKKWGCVEVTLLGCVYDHVSHEEIMISSVVQDTTAFNRLRALGCRRIEYDGPAAVHSAFMETARTLDVSCSCVWAHFPFYLRGPHEMIVANLLSVLGGLIGVGFDTSALAEGWAKREQEIEALITEDQEFKKLFEAVKRERTDEDQPRSSKVVRLAEFLRKRGDHPDE